MAMIRARMALIVLDVRSILLLAGGFSSSRETDGNKLKFDCGQVGEPQTHQGALVMKDSLVVGKINIQSLMIKFEYVPNADGFRRTIHVAKTEAIDQ
ncbi:hypothetical protein BC941DRAFT_468732 [Chlamydoabsidia padenii]|nr:hypothetical protein BC941DRAFT_468732 [Chlamydoabsidia padenii]